MCCSAGAPNIGIMQAEMQRETTESPVSFEQVMASVGQWMVAAEALAAVGAELSLSPSGADVSPEVRSALRAVSSAAGLENLDRLPPQQREMAVGLIRLTLHHAVELVDRPARAPGWSYTEPAILEGWGRGSMIVPGAIKATAPELADVRSFLDVGTGIGLLAVAAARVWPNASVVGIDIWSPSLELAQKTVREAGLEHRITIRDQDAAALDDVAAYDCAWVPTFFFQRPLLETVIQRVFRALQPGGWMVLGRFVAPPNPLAAATSYLRLVRGGGADYDVPELSEALRQVGGVGVRVLPRQGPAPLEYIIAQRP
jgi:predicted O-methyltransferase YrrM